MLNRQPSSLFHIESTGDPGRDRNARTLQFSCYLLAFAIGLVAILNLIATGPPHETLLLLFPAGSLVAGRQSRGKVGLGGADGLLSVLLTAVLLVFQARDGFRSHVCWLSRDFCSSP